MIEALKPNSIPNAILIQERTNGISQEDINICEAQNFRQMAEIKKLKSESCCYKYCYKYDDIIQLGGVIIFVFIFGIYFLVRGIIQVVVIM